MADSADTDALLTAYLDGELDDAGRDALEKRLLAEPPLKVRLDQLARGGRPFGPAYDALLAAAPEARMQAMLADLVAKHERSVLRSGASWWSPRAIAAALVIFIAGGLVGYAGLPLLIHPAPQQPGWRQVVAEYQGLTTAETLAAVPDDAAAMQQQLTAVSAKLAVDLTTDKLVLPDATLKRVQLYEFRGRPLVQLAYLAGGGGGPMALCIIANGRPDEAPAFETREGFNIVFWTDGGRGYMLIGKQPRATLEAYAGDLEPRV